MRGAVAARALGSLGFILIALVVIAGIGMLGYVVYYYIVRGLFAPTRRATALVVRKTSREHSVTVRDRRFYCGGVADWLADWLLRDDDPFQNDVSVYASWDYFITFSFNGMQQEFSVSEEVYSSLNEGDQGLLVYKGNIFKYFLGGVSARTM